MDLFEELVALRRSGTACALCTVVRTAGSTPRKSTARMLVLGARLLRAYFYMQDPGRSLDEVVERLGYGSARLFARQVRAATGLTPTALRQSVPPDEFVALLTARLARRGERTNAVQ